MPFSHKFWKERYFFVSGRNWEYNPVDQENTLGVLTSWTTLENIREFSLAPIGSNFRKSLGVSNSGLVVLFQVCGLVLTPMMKRRSGGWLGATHERTLSSLGRIFPGRMVQSLHDFLL